jgi:hypothetical protein
MPFRSKAQVRKFGAMVKRGEMSKAKFEEWLHETPNIKRLPERVGKKKVIKKKSKKSKK